MKRKKILLQVQFFILFSIKSATPVEWIALRSWRRSLPFVVREECNKVEIKKELNPDEDLLILGNRILGFYKGQSGGEGWSSTQLKASLNFYVL